MRIAPDGTNIVSPFVDVVNNRIINSRRRTNVPSVVITETIESKCIEFKKKNVVLDIDDSDDFKMIASVDDNFNIDVYAHLNTGNFIRRAYTQIMGIFCDCLL